MRVAHEVLRFKEPFMYLFPDENVICTLLRRGPAAAGSRRSSLVSYSVGEMVLWPRNEEKWVRTDGAYILSLGISHAVLSAAGAEGNVELGADRNLVGLRIRALVSAVNAERLAGFPSGKLFLDSVEQAIAAALINRYANRRPSLRMYRGGLAPARLRRVLELIDAKIDSELRLHELAESADLSASHFSQMFRRSTGESPHQFVSRTRVERAKELLRASDGSVLDVALSCGFKTQQHFARIFRSVCGASPTEYRGHFMRAKRAPQIGNYRGLSDPVEHQDDSRNRGASRTGLW